MKYISTRGDNTPRSFCDILLAGLAPDGGLYMPESYPKIDAQTLEVWRGLYGNGKKGGYANLAHAVLSLYIDDIPPFDLLAICQRTYTSEAFGSDAITPLQKLDQGLYLEGLSNGDTAAFKDIALQLLGNLFEYQLALTGGKLNILGGTSGDTGSAAEYAMLGKKGIKVFMLSPKGRMSDFQRAQMGTINDANIFNLSVEGTFDDCQAIVKAVSNDSVFKQKHDIGTVNSINWARIVAQVVYYFAGYFQATGDNNEMVSFTIPSGNFGNACAAHVARMMGLPIESLVVATNENDVLDEFFRTGVYRRRDVAFETSSPSMDIVTASNLERYVFDILHRDGARVKSLFENELSITGSFNLSTELFPGGWTKANEILSGVATEAEVLATIRDIWEKERMMIDPHTAVALKVAREKSLPWAKMIVMETALPVKFPETIFAATGVNPPVPARFANLEKLPQFFDDMPNDTEVVKAFIVSSVE